MATAPNVHVESKTATKRKAKTEKTDSANADTSVASPSAELTASDSHAATNGVDSHSESLIVKELTKNIRNLNKKLSSSAKADAVVSENPDVALDDLVAQKKLNNDQRAQILKKPGLQAQLNQLEEQLASFRTFASEIDEKAAKERSALVETHEAEMAKVQEKATQDAEGIKAKAVEDGLRVIIQFLHGAASKRQVEDAESDEARAFEGALLLVYQGNDTALSTLKNLVYGTEDKVSDVSGELLDFTFAQVKEFSYQSAQDLLQAAEPEHEEEVAVPEANNAAAIDTNIDSTVANAGLTELADAAALQTEFNATDVILDTEAGVNQPEQISTDGQAANAVAEGWDLQASTITDTSANNDEWVQVPRDPAETETGLAATPNAAAPANNSWAEEVGAVAAVTEQKPVTQNDGFQEVKRERGGGRGGRGGRGEHRGRGRGRDGHRGGGNRGNRDGHNGGRGARNENKS